MRELAVPGGASARQLWGDPRNVMMLASCPIRAAERIGEVGNTFKLYFPAIKPEQVT